MMSKKEGKKSVTNSENKQPISSEEWRSLKESIKGHEKAGRNASMPKTKIQQDINDSVDEQKLLEEGNKELTADGNNEGKTGKRNVVIQTEVESAEPQIINEVMETFKEYCRKTNEIMKKHGNILSTILLTVRAIDDRQKELATELKNQRILLELINDQLCEQVQEPDGLNDGEKEPQVTDDVNKAESNNELTEVLTELVKKELISLGLKNKTVQNEGNNSIVNEMKEAIIFETVSEESNTRRDYKLLPKTRFEHFYDYLTSELRANDLLYVIDSSVKANRVIDNVTAEKNKFKVRDILMDRLDQKYYSKVVHLKDPIEIIQKIKELKRCESNMTTVMIRQNLYSMKYQPDKESSSDFCEKFEDIVRSYENISDKGVLSEEEKRDFFYNAIMTIVPEVQTVELISKSAMGVSLTYEQLKMYIIEADANKKQTKSIETRAALVTKRDPKDRCYECDDFGHLSYDCSRKGMGLRKCYECLQYTTHKGNECPQRLERVRERGIGRDRGFMKEYNRHEYIKQSHVNRSFIDKQRALKRKSNENMRDSEMKKPTTGFKIGRDGVKNVNRHQNKYKLNIKNNIKSTESMKEKRIKSGHEDSCNEDSCTRVSCFEDNKNYLTK